LTRSTRWGEWEEAVLSRCGTPERCQELIRQRSEEVRASGDERDIVRGELIRKLKEHGLDPHKACVRFAPACVADVMSRALNNVPKGNPAACRKFNSLRIPEITRHENSHGSGYVWRGSQAPVDSPVQKEIYF